MKRNLFPLLGVAFVAAVVATGIFYALLLPRLRASAAPPAPAVAAAAAPKVDQRADKGPSLAIPNGSRAVSIHPAESTGVIALLRAGSRVDIQVIDTRGSGQLKRMMEDVEVLGVQGAEQQRPVVTLLVRPEDADRLSLADASMQLRVVARNPNDRSTGQPQS
jgi:Flp pilus assembly protein CpaB